MMELTQDLVVHAVRALHGGTLVPHDGATIDFAPPWPRVRYKEAAAEALGVSALPEGEAELRALAARAGVRVGPAFGWGRILDEVVSERVQPKLLRPTFLLDHPRDVSPLAKARRGDPTVVERFELVVAGMEVANAFSEQNDPLEQRLAFEAQTRQRERGDEEAQMLDEDYLRALEMGMPPTGGVGIGIDRLAMLLTDQRSIRDVILFPQMRPEEERA
jgi:lysyl-tRNA synthetase class 2